MVAETLHPTDDSRAIVASVVRPSVPRPVRPVLDLVNLATVGLLPPVLRARLGLGWGPHRERLLAASTLATRRALPLLPGLLREFPMARHASRRLRQAA
jgi:uncharacterized protein (DUF2236 family)